MRRANFSSACLQIFFKLADSRACFVGTKGSISLTQNAALVEVILPHPWMGRLAFDTGEEAAQFASVLRFHLPKRDADVACRLGLLAVIIEMRDHPEEAGVRSCAQGTLHGDIAKRRISDELKIVGVQEV